MERNEIILEESLVKEIFEKLRFKPSIEEILNEQEASYLKKQGLWVQPTSELNCCYTIALTNDSVLDFYYKKLSTEFISSHCKTYKISMPNLIISKLREVGFSITILHDTLDFGLQEVQVNFLKTCHKNFIAKGLLSF